MGEFKSRLLDVILRLKKGVSGPVRLKKGVSGPVRSKDALIPLLRIMLCFVQVKGCTIKCSSAGY